MMKLTKRDGGHDVCLWSGEVGRSNVGVGGNIMIHLLKKRLLHKFVNAETI
jgi:hypothetical protein